MDLSDQMFIMLIMVAASGSVFLLVWSLYRIQTDIAEATRLDEQRQAEIGSPLLRILIAASRPLGTLLRYFTLRAEVRHEQTGHRPHLLSLRRHAERNLIAAGSPHAITPDEYLGMVLLCTLLGLAVGVGATLLAGWTVLIVAGLILGLLWPIMWLRSQVRKRKTELFRALPFALDLLTLSVEAGLDFTSALARITTKIKGTPLGEEFAEVLRQIQMGQPRAEALRGLAHRADLEEMSNFAGAMIQADELGASIGPVLRIQAQEMRVRREQLAEKKAMEAPVKILLPLILFIFPTVFLTILGPVALDAMIKYGILQ